MRFLLSILPMLTGITVPVHHTPSFNSTSPRLLQQNTTVQHADTLKHKTGAFSFTYNNQAYDAFVVTPSTQSIRMHWQTNKNTPYKTIDAVKQALVAQKNRY